MGPRESAGHWEALAPTCRLGAVGGEAPEAQPRVRECPHPHHHQAPHTSVSSSPRLPCGPRACHSLRPTAFPPGRLLSTLQTQLRTQSGFPTPQPLGGLGEAVRYPVAHLSCTRRVQLPFFPRTEGKLRQRRALGFVECRSHERGSSGSSVTDPSPGGGLPAETSGLCRPLHGWDPAVRGGPGRAHRGSSGPPALGQVR